MKKFFAVIKREYLQRVRARFFIVATVMGPVMLGLFTIVPMYIATKNFGGATRLAVIDQTGRVYDRFRDALTQTVDEEDDVESEAANANREQMRRNPDLSNAHFDVELV